jgi:IS30 family transposase
MTSNYLKMIIFEFTSIQKLISTLSRITPIPTFSARRQWENGYNERFNGILRQEVLNAEWFHSIKQAQVAINIWLKEYNHIRPHHALGMRPPMPETLLEKSKISGTEIGG